jgi:type IV secretory pathway TraG/TraD family ATPase VirD4
MRKVKTMDVAALASLPEWRAIVFNSTSRPVMVQTVPWFRDKELKATIDGTAPAIAADEELAELTDEERDALNDEDSNEPDEFVDIRE